MLCTDFFFFGYSNTGNEKRPFKLGWDEWKKAAAVWTTIAIAAAEMKHTNIKLNKINKRFMHA